jgi:nicotinamidase-related amidase
MLADVSQSAVVVIDIQPNFLKVIDGGDAVAHRTAYLLEIATLLDVPAFASEQVPARMGGTEPTLEALLKAMHAPIEGKAVFSALGCPGFLPWLEASGKTQVILTGIETPICVTQTTVQLLELGYDVMLAYDAIGGRSPEMHERALGRLQQLGAQLVHTEAIAYEWLGAADHPKFRDALAVLKRYSA